MNIALWIIAGYLAAAFLVAGASKLFIPKQKLAKAPGGGWVNDFSAGFVKALGAVEIMGAVGLILPAALGIGPVLVPLAAVGLGTIMIGAAIVTVAPSRVQARAREPDLSRLGRLRGVRPLRPMVLQVILPDVMPLPCSSGAAVRPRHDK
ncbi:MAG TPA: DoxX family protein [Acidimicrobiales bacterium]|nr:DoxX family protein [Acidimicrobiales bacterium]